MIEEDDEEVTTVHAGELGLPPAPTSPLRRGPPGLPPPEGTVRLHGVQRPPASREETVLLATEAPSSEAGVLRPSDSGWGTVVLPGGGHPDHVADRTQLLALDDPEDAAAITATARLSPGAPDPIDAVDTTTLPGIGRPARAEPPSASPSPFRSVGPEAWPIPRLGLASPPTGPADGAPRAASTPASRGTAPTSGPAVPPASVAGGFSTAPPTAGDATVPVAIHTPAPHPPAAPPTGGHPVVPISGGHPVVPISGAHPMVPISGGHPIVARGAPRGRGRNPAPTGAHGAFRPAASDDARLAWGFLLGVLITVAIVGIAVALALYLLR